MKDISLKTETEIKEILETNKETLILFFENKKDFDFYIEKSNILKDLMNSKIPFVYTNSIKKLNKTFYLEVLDSIIPSYIIIRNKKIKEIGVIDY